MATIIEWSSAAKIAETLIAENSMVSGMSMAEAASSLGYSQTASGAFIKTAVETTAQSVASSTASSAVQAGASTLTGGATSVASNTVLFETAGATAGTTTTATGGLASVALPVAASIAAAAGGYLIGNTVYNSNKKFFDELLEPLFDFVSDSSNTIPLVFDALGNTFMNKDIIQAVKTMLDAKSLEINNEIYDDGVINISLHDWKLNETVRGATEYILKSKSSNVYIYTYYNEPYRAYNDYYFSLEPFSFEWLYNGYYDGTISRSNKTVITVNGERVTLYNGMNSHNAFKPNQITIPIRLEKPLTYLEEWAVLNSELINGGKGLPQGVTKYTPEPSSVPPIEMPNLPQWFPVAVPEIVEPNKMPVPARFPDTSPSPSKLNPYINPIQPYPQDVPDLAPAPAPATNPFPIPNPVVDPTPNPTPSPSLDPSLEQSTTPIPPPDLPTPNDTGNTNLPPLPIIPPFNNGKGLLHVYNPNDIQVNQFGQWLWTTFSGDLIDTVSKLFNNPMDAVIGLHELYCTPTISSNDSTIKAGYLDSNVPSRLVTSRYTKIECGAITVPEYWGNYLDYSPYTKVFCYLPFIGMVELQADDIIGHGVQIDYKIDTYNGSCIALITTSKTGSDSSVAYQFSGNCAVEVPITSGMKTSLQSALIGAASTALMVGSGGAALPIIGASALRHGAGNKNNVQHSGTFGSSYGAMGLKKPYILVKRPVQKIVQGYNKQYGYPAHKMVTIGSCDGYLRVKEVIVQSTTATEAEKKLIEKSLKNGIYV